MEKRELGAWGEERAAKYLRGKGYTIELFSSENARVREFIGKVSA